MKKSLSLFLIILLLSISCVAFASESTSIPVTPESQGMDSGTLLKMFQEIKASPNARTLIGVIVARNGNIVAESYYNNSNNQTADNIYSATKSITSILTGIAVDKGYVGSIEDSVITYFPEYTDTKKQSMKIKHLLNMTSGLDWVEDGSAYLDLNNPATRMVHLEENPVSFILNRNMIKTPGETFNYNSGNSHILTAILQKKANMKALDFANKHLFEPLGITKAAWDEDVKGINFGGLGLRLTLRDFEKIGELFLNKGSWNGKQIVPAKWVEASTSKQISGIQNRATTYYGYSWWVLEDGSYFAQGKGGQYLLVAPNLKVVVAITSRVPIFGAPPILNIVDLYNKYILPACKSTAPLPENKTDHQALKTITGQI